MAGGLFKLNMLLRNKMYHKNVSCTYDLIMVCHQMLPNNQFGLKFGWCKHTRHVQATFVAHCLFVHCIINFLVESKIVREMRCVECQSANQKGEVTAGYRQEDNIQIAVQEI